MTSGPLKYMTPARSAMLGPPRRTGLKCAHEGKQRRRARLRAQRLRSEVVLEQNAICGGVNTACADPVAHMKTERPRLQARRQTRPPARGRHHGRGPWAGAERSTQALQQSSLPSHDDSAERARHQPQVRKTTCPETQARLQRLKREPGPQTAPQSGRADPQICTRRAWAQRQRTQQTHARAQTPWRDATAKEARSRTRMDSVAQRRQRRATSGRQLVCTL